MRPFHKKFLYFIAFIISSCSTTNIIPPPTETLPEVIRIAVDNKGHLEFQEIGYASWYGEGDGFNLRKTANGEIFNTRLLTAAHRTLPLPSTVRVTNLANQKSVVLKVNDRGPYINDRIIDLSAAAAELLDMKSQGIAKVKVECISCMVNNTISAP
jgi:rare lipoprotein A (peptidoglycan hydrolase)